MLTDLRIRDLGVIAQANLQLGKGLNVLTGETGAGKTMVVTALGLLLGARADSDLVRAGAKHAVVEGAFVVAAGGAAARRAEQAGADLEPVDNADPDNAETTSVEVIMARSVAASGRGRAHVGGRIVPVATLVELADLLVSAHGQSDQILLRSPARQRDALDAAGGRELAAARDGYTATWRELAAVHERLVALATQATARRAEATMLSDLLRQVEKLDPQPAEDAQLRARSLRLENAEDLARAAAHAHEALAGQDDAMTGQGGLDVLGGIDAARRALALAQSLEPELAETDTRLRDAAAQITDIAAGLASYRAGVDVDPAALASIQDRRADLTALVRRVPGADTVDEVLAWAATASARLLELDGDDDRIAQLQDRHAQLQKGLVAAAATLTDRRRATAATLNGAASAELAALAMPNATLTVEVEHTDSGPHGADAVSFLLTPHAGASARPIGKGASGGELSRVMLALEVCLTTQSDQIVTFVFDEVDAGVGGRAAIEIGRRLARLAAHSQVLVVTHLPQVAAFADHHFVVHKTDDGSITSSGVSAVATGDRVRELARMLAGQEDSRSARAHAQELLDLAADRSE